MSSSLNFVQKFPKAITETVAGDTSIKLQHLYPQALYFHSATFKILYSLGCLRIHNPIKNPVCSISDNLYTFVFMSRSKRFKVQYITGEANRRFGNNDPSLISENRSKKRITSGTEHLTSITQNVDRNCWFVECLNCSLNLETTMNELEYAVTFAEKHGKISKIVCQEQFDLVITNFIEAIREK